MIGKEDWGDGPWQDECDKLTWEYKSFPCLILRNMITGTLCGYVGVPPTHSAYEVHYDDIPVNVHGGLTYSKLEELVWWIGFDCAHSMDRIPGVDATLRSIGHEPLTEHCIYRDINYVKKECEKLADQLSTLTLERILQDESN